jgi:hypothetical protein
MNYEDKFKQLVEEEDNDDEEIDTSWITNYDKLNNVESINNEPLINIQMYFFYINSQNCVEKIINKTHHFTNDKIDSNNCSHISKESLFFIIENNKIFNNKRYNLTDLSLFSINNINSGNLIHFNNMVNYQNLNYYKSISIFNDIVILPSIFIFHSSSSLFFFFTEQHQKHLIRVKSILKRKKTAKQNEQTKNNIIIKHTKKAHFNE